MATTCLLFAPLGMKPIALGGESGFLSVGIQMMTLRKDESEVTVILC